MWTKVFVNGSLVETYNCKNLQRALRVAGKAAAKRLAVGRVVRVVVNTPQGNLSYAQTWAR